MPARGRATLDCGSKAIAAEAGDPAGYVLGHPTWRALVCSEEHMPLVIDAADDDKYNPAIAYANRENPESRDARTDGKDGPSGSMVAGEVSGIDAGSAYVGPEALASTRRRPWDVALAKRFQMRPEDDIPGKIFKISPGMDADGGARVLFDAPAAQSARVPARVPRQSPPGSDAYLMGAEMRLTC